MRMRQEQQEQREPQKQDEQNTSIRRAALPQPTDRLPLGHSALRVSPFCIGITSEPETIPAAYDAGINFFFFTADMHWPLYEPTRKGLEMLLQRGGGIRDEIVVGCVSYCAQPEFCRRPFHEALEAVSGLDRLDLLIAGGAYGREIPTRLEAYRTHLQDAFVGTRAIGTSFHDLRAALRVIERDQLDIAFIRYNAVHASATRDLFCRLPARRRNLLFNFKSTSGYVSPEAQRELGVLPEYWQPRLTDHYRFVLTRPELDGILCSPDSPDHVEQLVEAMQLGPLDEEEEQHLLFLGMLAEGKAHLSTDDSLPSRP
jgi:aryl-alcohol dehydrogenase-like predicted oxidoreductase